MVRESTHRNWGRHRPAACAFAILALWLFMAAFAGPAGPTPAAAQLPGGVNITVTASPPTVQSGQQVTISYTATPPAVAPPFASISSIVIDFGDGQSASGTTGSAGQMVSGSVTHVYSTPGTFTVRVSALASNGGSNVQTTPVLVTGAGQPPTISLTASPMIAQVGQPITFSYSTSTSFGTTFPQTRSILISYGDGAPLPAPPPSGSVTHTYNAPGNYQVVITATDSNGQSAQETILIQVLAATPPPVSGQPPTNVRIVNPLSAAMTGQAVTFNAATAATSNTNASIQTYSWSFGDGGTATGQSVSHAYTSPGPYTVTLTVIDSIGASAQDSTQLTISSPTPPSAPGVSVTFQPGWNLIAVPAGSTIAGPLGPLYTFQPGDTAYQVVQNAQTGPGYWAFFSSSTTATIPISGPQTFTKSLPAGQFVMLGNPGSTPATVSGADIVYTYSASTNYQQTTTLQPGQGAWVLSNHGGTVTITGSPR